MIESGLKSTAGSPVPLIGVAVKADVLAGHARVLVRQRFRNVEPRPIEAVYTFPLPADATLSAFAMVCEGRRLEGQVQEREAAFRTYDDALVAGHGAALLEQERPNVFTANVGNLLPNEETIVELEYLQRLGADEGALRWMLPTLVAPRYVPGAIAGDRTGGGWADPTTDVPDADRITPRIGDVRYGLRLDVTFELAGELEIESPSHAIEVRREDGRARVSFAREEVALDRDVVITARGVATGPLTGVVADRRGTEPGFFALTVVPDLFAPDRPVSPQEIVFLIDTSGSMEGASIVEAKAALKLCLRHLREGDRFNVIAFSSTFTSFAPSPVAFGDRTLAKVDAFVDGLRPSGGTELLQPLLAAVQSAQHGIVVLLTDGQVANEQQILAQVLAARGAARCYSFGIGTNVSDMLLRDLAKHTGGGVEFIHPGERLDDKVVGTFARAIAPRVTDVSVKLVGVESGELAPSAAAALVDGEPWTLFGRYAAPGEGRAEIRGKSNGQPFALDVPLSLPAASDHPILRKMWASERIRDLEAMEVTGRRAGTMKERIVRLAVEFGVSSPHTSFVVVEQRTGARAAQGAPETRWVPVNAPAGWAMFGNAKPSMPMSPPMQAPMAAPAAMAIDAMYDASLPPPPPSRAMRMKASALPQGEKTGKIAPSPAAAASAGGKGGGLLGGLKKALRMKESAAEEEAADELARHELQAPIYPTTSRLLETQLASGLWDEAGAGSEDTRRLRASAKALLHLVDDGITTAHSLHGAQIRKAVEAIAALASKLASQEPSLVEFALGVAWLACSGKRTRSTVESVVARTSSLAALGARFSDPAALRAHVGQLGA